LDQVNDLTGVFYTSQDGKSFGNVVASPSVVNAKSKTEVKAQLKYVVNGSKTRCKRETIISFVCAREDQVAVGSVTIFFKRCFSDNAVFI
jgi:hypothetical protein